VASTAKGGHSATAILREWLRERIAQLNEANATRLSTEAVEFLATDQDLLNQFVSERVYDTTSEIVRAVLLETRRVRKFYEGAAETPGQQAERIERWFDRMEHSPTRHYVRLRLMTRADLLAGAEERMAQGASDFTVARWYTTLAQGLVEAQTVGEVYTPEQVARAYQDAQDTVQTNLDHLMRGVDGALRRIMGTDTDTDTQDADESA
jgi:hypothetical protein